jgi:hypothetical protein
MDLNAVSIELDLVNPALAAGHLLNGRGQGRPDESGEGRLDADRRRFLTLRRP